MSPFSSMDNSLKLIPLATYTYEKDNTLMYSDINMAKIENLLLR